MTCSSLTCWRFSIPPFGLCEPSRTSARRCRRSGISRCRRSAAARCRTLIVWSSRSRLEPILAALRSRLSRQQASQPGRRDEDLSALLERTVAVDGTFLAATADIAWALSANNQRNAQQSRAARRALIGRFLAARGDGRGAGGHQRIGPCRHARRAWQALSLRPWVQQLCVARRPLPSQERQARRRGHFVVRYRPAGTNAPELVDARAQTISDDDRRQGIVSDRVGRFVSSKPSRHKLGDLTLREVLVEYESQGERKTLRLITNLLDVSAATMAQLYRYRWQIELFFRWLKCYGTVPHERKGNGRAGRASATRARGQCGWSRAVTSKRRVPRSAWRRNRRLP